MAPNAKALYHFFLRCTLKSVRETLPRCHRYTEMQYLTCVVCISQMLQMFSALSFVSVSSPVLDLKKLSLFSATSSCMTMVSPSLNPDTIGSFVPRLQREPSEFKR